MPRRMLSIGGSGGVVIASGSGTTNVLPRFNASAELADSALSDNGTTLSWTRAQASLGDNTNPFTLNFSVNGTDPTFVVANGAGTWTGTFNVTGAIDASSSIQFGSENSLFDTNSGIRTDIGGGTAVQYIRTAAGQYAVPSAGGFQWFSSTGPSGGSDAKALGLSMPTAGIMKITNGSTGGGSLQLQEVSAPSAPASTNVVIYAVDNGGKTELIAKFDDNSTAQICIQP